MGFDWVTKAKRNTVVYRKISRKKGKPRFARVTIREVLCEAYAQMPQTQDTQPICLAMPDLYMKPLGPEAVAQYADMAAFFSVQAVLFKRSFDFERTTRQTNQKLSQLYTGRDSDGRPKI